MKNKILRLHCADADKVTMEMFCAETNEIEPYRETKELGIIVLKDDEQFNFDLDEEDLDEMISYLTEMRDHIKEFNKQS